ncbi:MAG: MarR family transcriptional regulator [Firmicutes bacterium]|nr:MarR family transcriptional regulator [Bacillota bacterium]
MKDIDLNFPEGPYLIKIQEEKRVKMNHLKNSIPFHKSHLTRVINHLVEKGYILKEIDPEDQRGFIVSITEEGENISKKAMSVVKEWDELLTSVITKEEMNMIDNIQRKMVHKIAEYFGEDYIDEKNT